MVFGKGPALVGVVTEPEDDANAQGRVTCLLLNAGLVHRVGPNRLYVRLARSLAVAGHRVLRLDLSGRGDSDVRRDSLSFVESSVREIQSAMDHMEKGGSRRFVLLGICSGAINSLQLTIADPRVAGCVAIDGPAYPTPGYYVRRYLRRLGSLQSWRNTIAGQNELGRWLRRKGGEAPGQSEDEFANPFGDTGVPSRSDAEEILKGIATRGARILFVYSGSWTSYNYRNQLADAFPFVRDTSAIQVEYFPAADHTFTRLYNQRRLVETISYWVTTNWPPAGAGSAAGGITGTTNDPLMSSVVFDNSIEPNRAQSASQSDRKLRICFVAHSSYGEMAGGRNGEVGGIQRQQSLMARWLAARGHDVTMLTWDEGQDDEVVLDGVRVLKMCAREAGVRGARFFHPRWTSLRRALRRADAEIYYHNTSEYVTGQVAAWCRRAGRQFVFSVANDWDCDPRVLSGRSFRERILYEYGLKHASRIISQTTKQQRILRDAFGLDSTVIPMPCPPVPGSEQPRTEPPRYSPPRVLWVGRFVQAKRLEVLLDIAERAPDLVFEVAGMQDGEDHYSLEVLARAQKLANVRLLGRVPREEMPALYRAAACLCCTSGHEGFPNTFLEAWCQGVPLVSSFDPDHLIERRGLGLVAHDAVELTSAIRRLLASDKDWLELSQRCRTYYFENHTPESVMPLFDQVFMELVTPRKG